MKHERFLAWCLSTPWALMPERMAAYAAVLARRAGGMDEDDHGAPLKPESAAQRGRSTAKPGSIAVIPVYGTIVQRASQLDLCENGTSTQQIGAALADALENDAVSQILLDIDSPGGSVYGVQELAGQIQSARSRKPVVAIANSLAASAAYWIGSAAGEFYVTPGGEVGSIGVWTAHQDLSKALEAAGIDITLISAGEFKVEGNPFEPLGEKAQTFIQSRIDDYYGAFTRGVAKGRGVSVEIVRNDMGKGRVFGADQALAAKMVDGIATFDEVAVKMMKNAKASAPKALRRAHAERDIEIMG